MMETSLRRRVELIEGIGILMGSVIWSVAPRLALSAVTVDASESKKTHYAVREHLSRSLCSLGV